MVVEEDLDEVLDQKLKHDEARLKQLEDEEEKNPLEKDSLEASRFGNVSLLGESILETNKMEDYNWNFEDIVDLPVSADSKIIDVDSVNERCFILFSDLKLIEISLQTKAVIQEHSLSSLEGATEHLSGQKAQAFAMFKDLNMIAVASENGFHMFDYESELKHVKSVMLKNVVQMCFVEMYVVVVTEDEDNSEDAILLSYMIDGEEPEGTIKIK